MSETFTAPTAPAWQVLSDALDVFLSEKPTAEAAQLISASMTALKDAHFPDDHRYDVCVKVLKAGFKSADASEDYQLPTHIVEFLDRQIGQQALSEMLAADGKWEIEDSDNRDACYHVYTTDRTRFRRGVHNERGRMLAQSLFGGMPNMFEIDMSDIARRARERSSQRETEEPAAAASEPGDD